VKGIRIKQKRGFTLSELCIVLALVAVVATIVTSFCLVVHQRSVISSARLNIVNEVNVVETFVERWVDKMSEKGATFSISEDGTLTATLEGVDYEATFSEGVFNGAVPSGENGMTFSTTSIDSVVFEIESQNGDTIFFCTATALLPQVNGDAKEEKYTFCVNSRIGESFGGVATE
jgi:prepilin-type N-terminal cleavage/methylation domain-containing protein